MPDPITQNSPTAARALPLPERGTDLSALRNAREAFEKGTGSAELLLRETNRAARLPLPPTTSDSNRILHHQELALSYRLVGETKRALEQSAAARKISSNNPQTIELKLNVILFEAATRALLSEDPKQAATEIAALRSEARPLIDAYSAAPKTSAVNELNLQKRYLLIAQAESEALLLSGYGVSAQERWRKSAAEFPAAARSIRSEFAVGATSGTKLGASGANLLAALAAPISAHDLIVGGTAGLIGAGTALAIGALSAVSIPITAVTLGVTLGAGYLVGAQLSATLRKLPAIADGFKSGLTREDSPQALIMNGLISASLALPVFGAVAQSPAFFLRGARREALEEAARVLSGGDGFRGLKPIEIDRAVKHYATERFVEISPPLLEQALKNPRLASLLGRGGDAFLAELRIANETGKRFFTREEFLGLYQRNYAKATHQLSLTVGAASAGAVGGVGAASAVQSFRDAEKLSPEQRGESQRSAVTGLAASIALPAISAVLSARNIKTAQEGFKRWSLTNPEDFERYQTIDRAAGTMTSEEARRIFPGIGRDPVTGSFPDAYRYETFGRAQQYSALTGNPVPVVRVEMQGLVAANELNLPGSGRAGHSAGNSLLANNFSQVERALRDVSSGVIPFRQGPSTDYLVSNTSLDAARGAAQRAITAVDGEMMRFGLDRLPHPRAGGVPGVELRSSTGILLPGDRLSTLFSGIESDLAQQQQAAELQNRPAQPMTARQRTALAQSDLMATVPRTDALLLRQSFKNGVFSFDPIEQLLIERRNTFNTAIRPGGKISVIDIERILDVKKSLIDAQTKIYSSAARTPVIEAVQHILREQPETFVAVYWEGDLSNLRNVNLAGERSGLGAHDLGNQKIALLVDQLRSQFPQGYTDLERTILIRVGRDEFAGISVFNRKHPAIVGATSPYRAASDLVKSRLEPTDHALVQWSGRTIVDWEGKAIPLSEVPHSKHNPAEGVFRAPGVGFDFGVKVIHPASTPLEIFQAADERASGAKASRGTAR